MTFRGCPLASCSLRIMILVSGLCFSEVQASPAGVKTPETMASEAAPDCLQFCKTAADAGIDASAGTAAAAAESAVLLATFMCLRAAVALRSVKEDSAKLMWCGMAFSCFTRFLCDGVPLDPTDLNSLSVLAVQGVRELCHVYGLRTALRQFSSSCT
eukprot:TRINITY_DN24700_c0_g2_i1.p2 TRINITY_DN24700_c0_g2~~TRINITY_DN24700_c0_g2_i1.p2  ORF type:complete len:157 (-),score=30.89 TRINITY_DN24700_c0_g2_i1:183-653(-)